MKIAILGYQNNLVNPWDPDSINSGIPGSEECVIYASLELAKRGHEVVVYMDPPKDSIWKTKRENLPSFLPRSYYNILEDFYDVIICWRTFNYSEIVKRCKKSYNWLHDVMLKHPEGKYACPNFTGSFLLSKFHEKNITSCFDNYCKTIICGNGVVLDQFEKENKLEKKNLYSMGYYSNYGRGLIVLLLLWERIKNRFPLAELHVCYGRETWKTVSDDILNKIIFLLEKYKNFGVFEHGKVGHLELANIMMNNSIWTYPCINLSETFCITAVKAQLAGCIPVINSIGALDETVKNEGYIMKYEPPVQEDFLDQYFNLLVTAVTEIEKLTFEELKIKRNSFVNFAETFSWENVIDIWEKEFLTSQSF